MKYGIAYGFAVLEVLDDDALKQFWSDSRVPDAFGIDNHDRSLGAHAETRRFSAFDALWAEEKILSLQKLGEQRIDLAAPPIGRAEIARAYQDVA
jgi:hypothetical protein